MSNGEI